MLPQPLLKSSDIETEITKICNDRKRNDMTRYNLEENLNKMIKNADVDIRMNGYIGLAHLATIVDDDIVLMKNYMNKLGQNIFNYTAKKAHYYTAYAYFLLIFDKEQEAKEKLLLALDQPVVIISDFTRILSTAILIKDNEIYEKILEKCAMFKNTEEYTLIQMEVGETRNDFNLNNKDNYKQVDLDKLFSL